MLHTCLVDDVEIVASFRHEASGVADLHHPHIVSVYDRREWNGTRYIVMEYVRARSLSSLIRDRAPLAPAQAVDLAGQLAEAGRYVHRRGIVHRDLKPNLPERDAVEPATGANHVGLINRQEPPPDTQPRDVLRTSKSRRFARRALTPRRDVVIVNYPNNSD